MTVDRIDPVLIEKAIKARRDALGLSALGDELPGMEAALRVVFDELGLKEQHEPRARGIEGAHRSREVFRYISEWRPVEQGDAQ